MYMSSCRRVIQNFSQKLGKPDVTDPNKMMEHLNYFMKYLPEYLSKSPNRKHQHLAIMSNGKYFGPPEYMSDDLKILSNKKIIEMHSKSFCGAEYNDGSGTSPPEGVVNFTLGNKLKIGNPLRAEYWKPTFETYAELATKNELFFLLAVINRDHQRVDAIIEATFPVDKLDEDAPYVVRINKIFKIQWMRLKMKKYDTELNYVMMLLLSVQNMSITIFLMEKRYGI